MTAHLVSPGMGFRFDPGTGSWEVRRASGAPALASAAASIHWSRAGRTRTRHLVQGREAAADPQAVDTTHGACRELIFDFEEQTSPFSARITWRAAQETPLLLWRVEVFNHDAAPIHLEEIGLLRVGLQAGSDSRQAWEGLRREDSAFFANGWQSWSFAGALGRRDLFPRSRLGPLTRPMRVNPGTPQPRARGHFSSDMFGVLADRRTRAGVLAGFLSQREAFGTLDADLRSSPPRLALWANCDGVRLDPGGSFVTDWACVQFVDLDVADPLGPYLEAAARENRARRQLPTPVGWCSWYMFFQAVTQEDVLANLRWAHDQLDRAPLHLIQIDDGFEADVGDWFATSPSFPEGLASLSEEIRRRGFRPGLWLAPFIAKPKAHLSHEHPEWLLRGPLGRPVNAGFVWNTFGRALDVSRPEVVEWSRRLVRTAISEWGFDYLKLDFLYAGALDGKRHDATVTRAQALRRALEAIRDEAGEDVTLVGCGCPLGSGIGVFDAMRIGPDVAPTWHPEFKGVQVFFDREPDYPSARNAIRNTLTRASLHRRWWVNDPDCILLRSISASEALQAGHTPADTDPRRARPRASALPEGQLTEPEVESLATAVALSAGSLIFSDHLPALGEERQGWLSRLIPPLPAAARAVDWFDAAYPSQAVLPLRGEIGEWFLAALFNWSDESDSQMLDLASIGLPPSGAYHSLDFWRAKYRRVPGSILIVPPLASHGVCLLSIRPVSPGPAWLGDTLHVSQGLHVREWRNRAGCLSARLDLGHAASGSVWLALPSGPTAARVDGDPVPWVTVDAGVYRLDMDAQAGARLEVEWG